MAASFSARNIKMNGDDNIKGTRVRQCFGGTNRTTLLVPGLLSLTTVVLLIVLLYLTIQWSQRRTDALEGREHEVCVQCGTLTEPFPGKNNTDMCCGKTSTILMDLIAKFSQQKFTERETSRMLSNYGNDTCTSHWVAVAIKLSGINRDVQLQERHKVIHFNDDPNANETHFHHEKGLLHVKKKGFFHIYSQIKIKHNAGSSDVVYNHWIHHYSPDGTDRKVLESSKSSCESVSDQDEITLMHGAVFELNVGDKLGAMTSHPQNLSSEQHGHFFGMYQISSSG